MDTQRSSMEAKTGAGGPGRRGVRGLLVLIGLTAVLGLALSGCRSDSSMSPIGGPGDLAFTGPDGGVPALAMSDLPGELNLTPDQKTRMEAALDKLRKDAAEMRAARGPRQGGRHGRGEGGPRRGGDRPGRGSGAGPLADREPPMLGFLVSASQILTPDQFTTFAKFLSERRVGQRPGAGDGMCGPDGAMLGRAGRMLGLTEDQQTKMHATVTSHAEQMRAVYKSLGEGTITLEQAQAQAKSVRDELKQEVQSILTADQWDKVQKFRAERLQKGVENRLENFDRQVDRQAEFLSRVLGLTEEQSSQARELLQGTLPQRRQILEQVGAGTLDPQDAAFEIMKLERDTAVQIRALLTPEQAQRFDALMQLLPRGEWRGMGPGMGMGAGPGPCGGPMGGLGPGGGIMGGHGPGGRGRGHMGR